MDRNFDTNAVFVTWSDIDPVVFKEIPQVLESLGLSDQGVKMMKEQNRMIRVKHDIKCMLDGSKAIPSGSRKESDPFDFKVTEKPYERDLRIEKMRTALNLSALRDTEYRECAKGFLTDLIPAVTEKKETLMQEIDDLQLEMESMQAKCKAQIRQKETELKRFMCAIGEVADSFYLTDTGSGIQGGHVPCERPDHSLWMLCNRSHRESDGYLRDIMSMIDRIEHPAEAPSVDPNYNVKPNIRETEGSVAPYGGYYMEGKGFNAPPRKALDNVFARLFKEK